MTSAVILSAQPIVVSLHDVIGIKLYRLSPSTATRIANRPMSKRTDRKCAFCGSPAGSREHALPDWLAKAMGRVSEPAIPAVLDSRNGWQTQGNPRASGNLITKKVCHGCNTGWMCTLEADVKPILADWIAPDRTNLSRESLMISDSDLTTLNRWLIKTAVCLGHVIPKGSVEKLPPEAGRWSIENTVPESCKVYAAWIRESAFAMKLCRGFRLFNGGKFYFHQQHRYSFDFAIQFNHLGMRITNAPEAELMVMQIRDSAGQLCTPNFWSYGIQPPGTLTESCVFDDFGRFTKACLITTGSSPGIHPTEALKASRALQSLTP